MTAHAPYPIAALRLRYAPNRVVLALDALAFTLLCAFVYTLPWGEAAPLIGGLVLGNWIALAALGVAALRTLIDGRMRRLSVLHSCMLALIAWSAVTLFWSIDPRTTVTRIGTYVQLFVAVWMMWELAETERRVHALMRSFVAGGLTASLITLFNFFAGRTAAQLTIESGRAVWDTSRYSVAGFNENDLGLVLALTLPMALYLACTRQGWLTKLICWLQLVAGMTAIFLTSSRGALVAAIIGLSMLPVAFWRLSRWQKILSIVAAIGALISAQTLVPHTSWVRFLSFGSELMSGTLTHRTMIWAAGLDTFRDHAFAGVGSGAYGLSIVKRVDFTYFTGSPSNAVAHNTFLSILVELGVIGALIFLVLLVSMFYSTLRMGSLERWFWITLLVTWMVGVLSLTWEYHKQTWFVFGLIAAHAYARRTEYGNS
jgi:hypothetical protein